MRIEPQKRGRNWRRLIDRAYSFYPKLPRFSAGQELDIPPHRSAFVSRGECGGTGSINDTLMDGLTLFQAYNLSPYEKALYLTQGTGECKSCGRGFSWRMNPASEEMNVTFAARANQFFRT